MSLAFYTLNDVFLKRVEKKKLLGRHKQDISLKSVEAHTFAK